MAVTGGITMTDQLTKTFFDTFEIECNVSFHQQFNGAQVARGLEVYKERQELAKSGIIKIWHKMLNPRPENDCVYWGEYHYPQITDRILLELICIICPYGAVLARDVEYLKQQTLENCIKLYEQIDIKQQIQALFEET
jgi:hypothetical protein